MRSPAVQGKHPFDVAGDPVDRFRYGEAIRVDHQLASLGRFVRRGNTREIRDLAGPRLLVQPLGVAPLAGREIGLDEDFVEFPRCHGPRPLAVRAVGRDERADDDEPGFGEQRRDLAHATDVLGPVVGAEAEIRVEPMTQIVAVQDVGLIAPIEQMTLELDGQG